MTVLASGADSRYGHHLLNMIGSVKARSDIFEGIVVYDLGLNRDQRALLDEVRGVEVRTVPAFVPHWAQGRTWKTWIWTHLEADEIFWLDAGATVLRPLREVVAAIRRDGYFAVSQGHPNRKSTPSDYVELYGLTDRQLDQEAIAAGIFGFRTTGGFYDEVVVPSYDDAVAGRTLGFSAAETERLNRGLDHASEPILRDCEAFRWDQTVLNVHFAQSVDAPRIHDIFKFAGWESDRAHPEQVIWSHRRRGEHGYLLRLPYRWPKAPLTWARTVPMVVRSWRAHHRWLFQRSTYLGKLRRLLGRS